jgi:hypothetical protein
MLDTRKHLKNAAGRIGGLPAARARWLTRFAHVDLYRLPDAERQAVCWEATAFDLGNQPLDSYESNKALSDKAVRMWQQTTRAGIVKVLRGEEWKSCLPA